MVLPLYLDILSAIFHRIQDFFDEGKLERHTDALEMLEIGRAIYTLTNRPGVVLECGCAQGFSSCCLSYACALTGKELVIADSFQGLPLSAITYEDYDAGSFSGGFELVQRHMRIAGCSSNVTYVSGCFAETLQGWNRNVSLLWMDVDLYRSTLDVLQNIIPFLQGPIYSHEFGAEFIDRGEILPLGYVSKAFKDYFDMHRIHYEAEHKISNLARIEPRTHVAYDMIRRILSDDLDTPRP